MLADIMADQRISANVITNLIIFVSGRAHNFIEANFVSLKSELLSVCYESVIG